MTRRRPAPEGGSVLRSMLWMIIAALAIIVIAVALRGSDDTLANLSIESIV